MRSSSPQTISKYGAALLFSAVFYVLVFSGTSSGSSDLFPMYSCIEDNVVFWKKVYSEYSLSQGVIHDKERLGIIYEVLDLKDSRKSGSSRTNRWRIRNAKDKYRKMLRSFAAGHKPSSAEEKRIYALFGDNPKIGEFSTAARSVRFQLGQKDRFREGVIRSGAYIDQIKEIFTKQGVPTDLMYIAHVESSFNYKAYSKFGAAGIWQFTRSTGKMFMEVGYTLDERRDPITSSHAAAKLLRQNHARLGNWPMAITSYNHGLGGMTRAKRSKKTYPDIFKYYRSRIFGFASKNFYSEFLAAREVAKNYRKYFGDLQLAPPLQTSDVVLAGYVPVHDLVRFLAIDIDTIKKYNPALRTPVFQGQKHIPKGYTLRLPGDFENLSLLASVPDDLYKSAQKRSSYYQVRKGDTVSRIARRNRVPARDLILANQLNARGTIYVGQTLRIPIEEDEKVITVAGLSKQKVSGRSVPVITLAQLEEQKEQLVPAELEAEELAEPRGTEVVQEDDDLIPAELSIVADEPEVAEETGGNSPEEIVLALVKMHESIDVPADDLDWRLQRTGKIMATEKPAMAEYNIDAEAINIEQAVKEGTLEAPEIDPAAVLADLKVKKTYRKDNVELGVIQVEAEETLGHYADWLEVPTWKIRRYNGFSYGRMIRVNQPVRITFEKVNVDIFEERRFEYHKEIIEDFLQAYQVDTIQNYQVKSGDNIWSLCRNEFELPFWLVKKYNATVNLTGLKPSQQLKIPVVVPKQIEFAGVAGDADVGT